MEKEQAKYQMIKIIGCLSKSGITLMLDFHFPFSILLESQFGLVDTNLLEQLGFWDE